MVGRHKSHPVASWPTYSSATHRNGPTPPGALRRSRAGSAALSYAVGAVAWIVCSDLVVEALGWDTAAVNIGKGFFFIAATTVMLWLAFRRHEHEVAAMITDVERASDERIAALEGVTRAVGAMIEARDPYTAGHQQRVGDLSAEVGRRLGLGDDRIEGLRIAGYLHDVGKIAVPTEILTRTGGLSDPERALVEQHSRQGHDVLVPVPFGWPIAQVALQHHERLDGSGYPQGLRGDEILLDARIVAVADVFNAMTSERPYREAGSIDAAVEVLSAGAGTHFDSAVVHAMLEIIADSAG